MPFHGNNKVQGVSFVGKVGVPREAEHDASGSPHLSGAWEKLKNIFNRQPDDGVDVAKPQTQPSGPAPTPTAAHPPLQGVADAVEDPPVVPEPSPGVAPPVPPEPMSTEREKMLDDEIRSKLDDDPEALQQYQELCRSGAFKGHSDKAVESRVAVLEQARNYTEAPVIEALNKLSQKKWYKSQSFDDQQRTAKMIAYNASEYTDGANEIRQNTVDYLLDRDDLGFSWAEPVGPFGGFALSDVSFLPMQDPHIYLSRTNVPPGDGPLENSENFSREENMIVNAFAHEVNHISRNGYPYPTYDFYMNEYRADYVGNMALEGEEPSREAMFENIKLLIENYIPIRFAFLGHNGAEEQKKIVSHIAEVVGLDPDTTTAEDILEMTVEDIEDPQASAPVPQSSGARGDINDLNNDGQPG